jgi:transcriptional regulator with XRE-family HTH domain
LQIEIAMTPTQLRAARALLNWSQKDLGRMSSLCPETIRNIENRRFNPAPATVEKITRAFTSRGVEFIEDRTMQGVVIISKARQKSFTGQK